MEEIIGKAPNSSMINVMGQNAPVQNFVAESRKKRNSYTLATKRDVLERVSSYSRNSIKNPILKTALDFNIKYDLVQKWWAVKEKVANSDADLNSRKIGVGRKRKFPDEEKALTEWVADKRSASLSVSPASMAAEAMTKFPNQFKSYDYCKKWVYNILDRNGLSIRRKTHDQVILEEAEMGNIHLDFVVHFNRLREFHDIPLHLCVNMDETGCYFEMSPKTTIHKKGDKHVNVKSTGNPNHCTVFLSVALDGSKLKPLVVFKGAADGTLSKKLGHLDQRNSYICQEKGYCDASVMSFWIKECLIPYHTESRPALLMMDNFKVHLVKSVRNEIAENRWLQLNLPPNMTSRVQILDVGINKPFKDRMRAYYDDYMLKSYPEPGKITRELMGTWVADAWESLPVTAIINTAKKIGFIN